VKGVLIERYDLELTKREMDELMLALRVFTRLWEASELAEKLLEQLEQVFQGGGQGRGVAPPPPAGDDDGDDAAATPGPA
jgi:hypothetical protein